MSQVLKLPRSTPDAVHAARRARGLDLEQPRQLTDGPLVEERMRDVVPGDLGEVRLGQVDPERLVVSEFESVDAARAWYDSDDYTAIRTMREGAGEWRMVVVDGYRQGG